MRAFLAAAANQTRALALQTEEHCEESDSLWEQLLSRMSGAAIDAAASKARAINAGRKPVIASMQLAEATLRKFGSLMHEVQNETTEAAREEGVHILDTLCALELESSCAGEPPAGHTNFDDFKNLSFSAIHQINYAIAPPHVRKMVDKNPDVTLLEVGPNTSATMVYPGGAQALDKLETAHTQPSSITTFIPGTGSSKVESLELQVDRARQIAKATGGPAVAWLGYSAPESPILAIRDEPAIEGGKSLDRFLGGSDQRWTESQKIVVAYSFGSPVAGSSDLAHSGVDDLVVVGSPGTMHDHASELGVETWFTLNDKDPIGLARGAFGADPTHSDFGAKELPYSHGRPGGHKDYFDDPAFYAGLGAIVR